MGSKLMTVVGARPQFVKAAVVSRELRSRGVVAEELVHTGQHFDRSMSQVFFDELDLPRPAANLGIAGGTHAEMTARMLVALEKELVECKPDALLVYGDTNSTLAGALAAAKLNVPVIHVEAGVRTCSLASPEEVNRVCVDHVAALLLACTEASLENLRSEGLSDRSLFVGDPMFDAFVQFGVRSTKPVLQSILDGSRMEAPPAFYYATCHRAENTSDGETLESLLDALSRLDLPVVYPVHPRNRARAMRLAAEMGVSNVLLCEPVGYLESIWLVNHAAQVITDSGGLQREAFFAAVKCTTLLDFAVWPETMVENRNVLAKPTYASITEAMSLTQRIDSAYRPFGDGSAASRIADCLERFMEAGGRL